MNLIDYACRDDVATLTLNDPKTLNALSADMVEQLMAALDRAEREARAVILTGSGRGFCSGANLSGGDVDPAAEGYDAGLLLETHYNPLILRMRDLKLPIVAAVNGVAAGIGFSMALVSDHVIAAESAYFYQAFRHIGLVPDGGSAYLLVRAIGRLRAAKMMMAGERVSSADALAAGLVNSVSAGDALLSDAFAFATGLATGPTVALHLIKRLSWESDGLDFEQALRLERQFQFEAGRTADHREGVAAFLAKRTPGFIGA
ncbi:enoyl-CoA hydratase-related protein [Sphingobium chlorophenolicum]|uniref:Enoyl-CoA hydratase n=1 Tax=Sphingobium chlorophenolicum TaxID=46429 RepID=A0A081R9Z4_SPHCR|nr:enoyl-CoA hydratase-related protein [Sphingobium chlorophenolicum]KEQ52017.1 Enoyl-CoA hydratase [Sphingobium chlorophenolicum]